MPGRGVPGPGGCLVLGGMPGGDHPGTATAAGGTHPTGMHSCSNMRTLPQYFSAVPQEG